MSVCGCVAACCHTNYKVYKIFQKCSYAFCLSLLISTQNQQEIKFLHFKKQKLNQQLNKRHLECANNCNGMRQYTQTSTDSRLDKMMGHPRLKINNKKTRCTIRTQKKKSIVLCNCNFNI